MISERFENFRKWNKNSISFEWISNRPPQNGSKTSSRIKMTQKHLKHVKRWFFNHLGWFWVIFERFENFVFLGGFGPFERLIQRILTEAIRVIRPIRWKIENYINTCFYIVLSNFGWGGTVSHPKMGLKNTLNQSRKSTRSWVNEKDILVNILWKFEKKKFSEVQEIDVEIFRKLVAELPYKRHIPSVCRSVARSVGHHQFSKNVDADILGCRKYFLTKFSQNVHQNTIFICQSFSP